MSSCFQMRDTCRLCGSDNLEIVLELTPTPPANELLGSRKASLEQEKFPLQLFFCGNCSHVQLGVVVDPDRLFSNYVYVSGTSPVFREHFRLYAQKIIVDYKIEKGSLVLDIGSNDGTLLSAFKEEGMRVQGVDPAKEIASRATGNGIDTIADFFTDEIAGTILADKGKASVVVANNVFAHIDDLSAIFNAMDKVLAPGGIISFEVSYLLDVLNKVLFDTIYHEHLDYHSLGALVPFLEGHGLQVVDAQRIDSHGGSIRVIVQRKGGKHPVQSAVREVLAQEEQNGLHKAATYLQFAEKINDLGARLNSLFGKIKSENKTIAGFGLPAKATTLMFHFGIGNDVIDYVVDDNPLKQGLFSPGLGIPIVDSQHLKLSPPDYIIILAWNFADAISAKLEWFLKNGGKIIIPLPELVIKD